MVLPLLSLLRRGRRRTRLRGLADAAPAGVPSPQRIGYSGVVLERLVEHARTILAVEYVWIGIGEPSEGLTCVAGAGVDADAIGARAGNGQLERPTEANSAPVGLRGVERGVVCVGPRTDDRDFDGRDRALLAEVASLTTAVLEHHGGRQLAAGDSASEIRALVAALAEIGGGTYRHSLEVAATARVVGELLGLDGVDLVEVELAALLHDIGKLRLPSGILDKPGPLDDDERGLVKLHPEWGAEIVAGVPGLEAISLLVRLHHERPDGEGYPHGLTGDRQPLASRIVSVCDAYGAMTRGRDYREPLALGVALEALELNSGTQFDPEVVRVLTRFAREPVPAAARHVAA